MNNTTEDKLAMGCASFIGSLVAQVILISVYGWIAYLVFDAFFSHDFSVWPFVGAVALIYAFLNLARGRRKPLNLTASDNR